LTSLINDSFAFIRVVGCSAGVKADVPFVWMIKDFKVLACSKLADSVFYTISTSDFCIIFKIKAHVEKHALSPV